MDALRPGGGAGGIAEDCVTMANLFHHGANGYSTHTEVTAAGFWDSALTGASGATVIAGPQFGRYGRGISMNANTIAYVKNLSVGVSTIYVGMALNLDAAGATNGSTVIQLMEAGAIHVGLSIVSDGTLRLWRTTSATLIKATGPAVFSFSRWVFLELKAVISDTAGAFEVRLDGINVLDSTAGGPFDTRNANTGVVTQVQWNGIGSSGLMETDWYINDSTGTDNNTFAGDSRVDAKMPNAAGAFSDFTPSAGSNYQNIDDGNSPDDDATYNESNTATHKDTFKTDNTPSLSGAIKAVSVFVRAKKTDAASRLYRSILRLSGVQANGPDRSLVSSYADKQDIFERDPNGNVWTASNLNSTNFEAGYELRT